MDDATLTTLRAAGAMIGETNLASWEELLDAFQASGVRFGIANARREFDTRQVTATQTAKALRHKLKVHEPERKKGEPLVSSAPTQPNKQGPKPAAVVDVKPAARDASRGPKFCDYAALLREHGPMTFDQLGTRAGVRAESARAWLLHHQEMVEFVRMDGRAKVYGLKATVAPGHEIINRAEFDKDSPPARRSAEQAAGKIGSAMTGTPMVAVKAVEPVASSHGLLAEIEEEFVRACRSFKPFNSAHEGFAVIAEEVDELWDHVRVNQSKRDWSAMRKECVQIAAMAARFITDVCDAENRGHEKRSA